MCWIYQNMDILQNENMAVKVGAGGAVDEETFCAHSRSAGAIHPHRSLRAPRYGRRGS